jgi:fatty-acid peroxygenase
MPTPASPRPAAGPPNPAAHPAQALPPPSDGAWEAAPALLLDGYEFIAKRRRRLRSDIFRTRLLFQETLCLGGADAARLFYDETRFQRAGAAPRRARKTLLGEGGVQSLDDDAHRHRKALFTGLLTPESIARLAHLSAEEWRRSLAQWEARADAFPLFPELTLLLLRAACRWAGVPLPETTQRDRAADLAAVIDGAGGFGPRHWRARLARRRLDRWMTGLVRAARAGEIKAPPASPLAAVAAHRDLDGSLLPPATAGVELFNLVRPIVATDRFLLFCAHALDRHPRSRERLAAHDPAYGEWFVHEVRRYYPFFPFAVARVRHDFVWRGLKFPAGARALLDLYGTDHDPALWPQPELFRPERFADWDGDLFNFIPQGGGDAAAGHRCAGEQAVVALMKTGAYFLAGRMDYEVPPQNLAVSLRRMPAQPADRFIVRHVRRRLA